MGLKLCEAVVGIFPFLGAAGAESVSRLRAGVWDGCAGAMWGLCWGRVGGTHSLLPGQSCSVPHTEAWCVLPGDLDPAQALATTGLLRGHHRSFLWSLHSRLSAGIGPAGPGAQPSLFSPDPTAATKTLLYLFFQKHS